ncbi:uroporphyrinogen-III synthase [Thalassotalea sp. M1531]|uniref:Uroporphyrinogen-III synthase n=1 Tax=Thalassotalea algicola TaxID=2716224 RepID=A0A7Y0Q561_9GAMM|nr:uroporphyrinogen-III synthase [Thalassotalea algicola]NMP30724.1 uroporphyrinogen-III synthase [Thalassotalea algicola]
MVANSCLLITRPEPQASQLASKLSSAGYRAICQPLFTYESKDKISHLQSLLSSNNQPILIFVSKAAVDFAEQTLPINQWSASHCIAVGTATRDALNSYGVQQVITPEYHDSEGILALPELSHIDGQSIIIVRGNGGRELIAQQLSERGATVTYFESYQRKWLTLPKDTASNWLEQQVKAIWITSNAILESVVQLTEDNDNYWQNTCLWFVASERIATNAKQLGLKHVVCTHGASDTVFINALNKLELINDR